MGTDIHMIVQKRETPDAPWVTVRPDYPCQWCERYKDRVCYWCGGTGRERAYSDRNYDVFAQLANVRNGRGFAGCDMGDGFVPICEPRGLPEDVPETPEYEDADSPECSTWMGDHSHSWLMLAELLAYDVERQAIHRGIVDRATWERWDRKGPPESWCGGINRPIISDPEARAGADGSHVQISWSTTYRSCASRFWDVFVPALQKLGHPDCVRIVFGFDS